MGGRSKKSSLVEGMKEAIQMKKRHFDVESDGFYGAYWKCKTGSDCAMIAMIGDDPGIIWRVHL